VLCTTANNPAKMSRGVICVISRVRPVSAIAPDSRYVATLRRPPMPRLAASVIFARLGFTTGPRYIWGMGERERKSQRQRRLAASQTSRLRETPVAFICIIDAPDAAMPRSAR